MNNAGKVNIMVIIIIVLVQAIIIGAGYFFFMYEKEGSGQGQQQQLSSLPPPTETQRPSNDRRNDRRNDRQQQQQYDDYDDGPGFGAKDYIKDYALFDLGDIILNPMGTERFFIAAIQLEYRQADKNLPTELKNKMPLMKDRVMQLFSRKSLEELRDIENRERYKEEVMRSVNSILLEGRVTSVIFEQFVIQ